MKVLELGCGKYKGGGCPYKGEIVGVDIDPDSKADIIADLNAFPWSGKDRDNCMVYFQPDEFDAVYSHHCLEHLEDTVKVMDEIWRITKPKGRVFIVVPYGVSEWSHSNPTHRKFFAHNSITHFTSPNSKRFRLVSTHLNYIFAGFPELMSWKGRLFRKLMKPLDWLVNLSPSYYGKLGRFYVGDADEIEWELEVVK
ncbi:MAG: SAM-dependent methyltransferase (plasmid) [Candidatus Fermentimicrarchaeum limneticum]|uniref:SAM-dependent methyltransferase n=1 Tax=Fermentimicrarchaeum limneticum TaxID=2795018 RepID=A0A7D6BTL3_FERL1|nr:MAG: SAM-dependent methyltransferase [Candidatus Fermentimicrarchaeum limneticum]